MSKTRIYAVTRKHPIDGQPTTRLVRATNPGPAVTFVTKDEYECHVADQEDLVAAFKAGVQVENEPEVDPKAGIQSDIEDVPSTQTQTGSAATDGVL